MLIDLNNIEMVKLIVYLFTYVVVLVLEIYFIVWTIKTIKKNSREIEELKNKVEHVSYDNEQYRKKIDLLENKVNFIEWKNGKSPE